MLIGIEKGFFAAEDLKLDIVYVQSSAALVQQVTAGSLGDQRSRPDWPIRYAPSAWARQSPSCASRCKRRLMIWSPSRASRASSDLKGKLISLGGPKDITRIYVERMLAPNGVKPGEFDMVFAGATAARASALVAGAVDAAILLPAFNFQAEAKGFKSLGLTARLCKRPAVLRHGGQYRLGQRQQGHAGEIAARGKQRRRLVRGSRNNRAEAVHILKAASGLIARRCRKGLRISSATAISSSRPERSRAPSSAILAKAMESLGDLPGALDIDKVVLPGSRR